MSGPVGAAEAPVVEARGTATKALLEVTESRSTTVGSLPVRRALPQRNRRTVGAWCFADHGGPVPVVPDDDFGIGPHPHMGLQTITWLLAGELVHRDSLGSEQPIRPGQLNVMTAGRGVAHAEEAASGHRGSFHGIQLWVAQPEHTRHDEPTFEHHRELPQLELSGGVATVLIGEFSGAASPARHDSDLVGVELALHGGASLLELRRDHEHALVVLNGAIEVDGRHLLPGHLGYLGTGRGECALSVREPTQAMLLGGAPFPEPILMWWNFVARDKDEMVAAYRHWVDDDGWFGAVDSALARIGATPPPWLGR